MVILKLVIIATLMATVLSSPITVPPSYDDSSYSSAPTVTYSNTPTVNTYSQAQQFKYIPTPVVSYSHAPLVSYSQIPEVSYSHVPVAVEHIPVETEHRAPANYEFKYGVHDSHTHDIKEQAERRHGDKVEGYYKLVEPDGTTRTVHYAADKHTGFHAQVQKSGHSSHPAVQKVQTVGIVAPTINYAPYYGHSYGYSAPSISSGSSHGLASSSQSYGTSDFGNSNIGHSSGVSYGGSYGYSSPTISYGGYGRQQGQYASQSYGESY